jgi:glycerol-3-phosphate acyltransferase PlsY
MLVYITIAIASYLLGSIPTGFLVARAKEIDIRAVGSGNIGATNAMRVLGKPAGIFVLLADVLKGYLACVVLSPLIFNWLTPHYPGVFVYFQNMPAKLHTKYYLVAGIFAVLGHDYTCWLRFKGGKGISTTAGVYLALAPVALGIALAAFISSIFATRYVSVGSIVAAIVLPIGVWFTNENLFLRIVTVTLCAMAIFKHRKNIQRLMAGTESRLGKIYETEAAE